MTGLYVDDYFHGEQLTVSMEKIATLILVLLLAPMSGLFSSIVIAASTGSSCAEDTKKLCADVEPGGGRIAKCLMERKAELTEECRSYMGSLQESAKSFLQACKTNVENFCKDVRPGRGRILKCLRENMSQLSSECAAVLP